MASLKLPPSATEKELKLTKLESDFYKACNAARCQDIELDNIRSCLLQELLEVEENKNVKLRKEIQEIEVCPQLRQLVDDCLWWVLFGIADKRGRP